MCIRDRTYTVKCGTVEQSITMDSLVYGSNSSEGGKPGSNGEDRGNMKEGGMQDGNGRGQAPGGMENPSRNAPPTDQTGDTSKENGSVEGETNL